MTADAGRSMRAMLFEGVGSPLRLAEVAVPEPGPGQLLLRVLACGVCRTDLHLLDGEVEIAHPPRVLGHQIVARVESGRPARRRPVARMDLRRVRVLPQRPREPLPPGALHRPRHRRGLRRVRRGRRAVLLPDPGRLPGRPGRPAAVRGPHRLPLPADVRRRAAPRALRLRRGRAHPRPGRARAGPRGLRVHARRRRRRTGVRARARRDVGRPVGRGTAASRSTPRSSSRPTAGSSRSRCAPSRPAGASCAAAST